MKNFIILNFIRLFGFTFQHKLKRVKLRLYPGLPNNLVQEVAFKVIRGENSVQVYRYFNPKDPIAKGAVLWRSAAITSNTISKEVGLLRWEFFISDYIEQNKPLSFIDNFYNEGLVLYELEYATPDQIQEHKDKLQKINDQIMSS